MSKSQQEKLDQLRTDRENQVGLTEQEINAQLEYLRELEREMALQMEDANRTIAKLSEGLSVDLGTNINLGYNEEIPEFTEQITNEWGENLTTQFDGNLGELTVNSPRIQIKFRHGFPVSFSTHLNGDGLPATTIGSSQVFNGSMSFETYFDQVDQVITSGIGNLSIDSSNFPDNLLFQRKQIDNGNESKLLVSFSDGLTKNIEICYDIKKGTMTKTQYGFSENESESLLQYLNEALTSLLLQFTLSGIGEIRSEWERINAVIHHNHQRLTSDEFTRTLAFMSEWVYYWKNDPDIDNKRKYDQIKQLLVSKNWVPIFEPDYEETMENSENLDPSTGYHGRVFINDQTKQLVFVHRGTEVDRGLINIYLDMETNAQIFLGMNQQIKSAKKYYKDFLTANPQYISYEIFHTGHSLGGAIAQELAVNYHDTNGDKAVSFSGLGTWARLRNYQKLTTENDYSYVNNYVVAQDLLIWGYPQAVPLFIENRGEVDATQKLIDEINLNPKPFFSVELDQSKYKEAHSLVHHEDGYDPAQNIGYYDLLKYYWLCYRMLFDRSTTITRLAMPASITGIGVISGFAD